MLWAFMAPSKYSGVPEGQRFDNAVQYSLATLPLSVDPCNSGMHGKDALACSLSSHHFEQMSPGRKYAIS